MQLKLYDYFLLLVLTGTLAYVLLFVWMPIGNSQYGQFNIFGASFLIFMVVLMTKFFIVSTAIGLEWALPRISKNFQNIKITQPSFTIFNKRIEIRIVDKHDGRGKVTF